MDPRSSALLFLLEEQIKKHPSSAAAGTARGFIAQITELEKDPVVTDTDYRGLADKLDSPGPIRVPIAGSEPRPRDLGEDKGASGPGVEADLLR